MAEGPAVNPNVDDIADRAKHWYANATQVLAATQYRLAELAGTGRLDPRRVDEPADEPLPHLAGPVCRHPGRCARLGHGRLHLG
jgi:hypothetical protein